MKLRDSIVSRIAVIYFLLLVFGLVIVVKLFSIQKIKNERWEKIADNLSKNTIVVQADRGSICADDGSLLATSVPGYYVKMDLGAEGVKKSFSTEADSLAYFLSLLFKDAPPSEYKRRLSDAYRKNNRSYPITPRKIDYSELQRLKKFPILRKGRFGGGMLVEKENKRINPLGGLALRTIGKLNKGTYGGVNGYGGLTGIEGAFEKELRGEDGVGYRENISGRWINRTEIQPVDGKDIITTINIRYQDIAEDALLKQLMKTNADWGTVTLMEVSTGKIKAIANLGRANGNYTEKYNYALGHEGSYEPGSTFKLVSLMAALEDGLVDTSDVFDTGNGLWKYKDLKIKDSDYDKGGHGKISVKKIFELSSNVGVAKIITQCYGKNQQDYIDRVMSFGINKPLDLQIPGEASPYFKDTKDKYWSGVSLASMSYGYEIKMTPLQVLTFYNAVANDGKMVKPMLIEEIRDKGAVVKKYGTEVIKRRIASRRTIKKARSMMEGVCETGTAKTLKSPYFKMAGKTGTAQLSGGGKGYRKGMYLSSFAGYFPADKPEYSMIVTFNSPRGGEYYGGAVAGPVFKEIAEKIFAAENVYDEDLDKDEDKRSMPDIRKGKPSDIKRIARKLRIRGIRGNPDTEFAKVDQKENKLYLAESETKPGIVPDVRGMGASSAVYLLENNGLQVRLKGTGKIREQSLSPGQKCYPGNVIYLTLR